MNQADRDKIAPIAERLRTEIAAWVGNNTRAKIVIKMADDLDSLTGESTDESTNEDN